jgi:type IV fimbrial biogenesis protein FimT
MVAMSKYIGFTLIEILVSLAILLSVLAIGVPSLNNFIVSMRVDNEISLLHRMLLFARNSAINNELYVTICPLNDSNICTDNWQGQLSVFSDINKNRVYEANNDELLLKVKPAIKNNDKLQYGQRRNALIYGPTGHLVIWGGNATFKYCPENHTDKSRGLVVSTSGRVYETTYNNRYEQDTNRSGGKLVCRD